VDRLNAHSLVVLVDIVEFEYHLDELTGKRGVLFDEHLS
jgi:hypothetical protein